MVDIHIIFETGEEIDIFTVESRIDEDLKNARKLYGEIKSYTVNRF